ncbi:MAG: hypothetical protein QM722_09335 [Piscinibacter sp.]
MARMAWRWRHAAIGALGALIGGCGGGGDDAAEQPGPPPDPLPPAGASRWAALEQDHGADGTVDFITLYSYDGQGRRTAARTYRAVNGVADGAPTRERSWTFDRWSRIVGSVDRAGARSTNTYSYVYGADGRLASQHSVITAADVTSDARFIWSGGHIVEVRSGRSGSSDVAVTQLFYDADGRVERVELDPAAGEYYANYRWRPDGRPAGMSVYSGFTASFGFIYDTDGRLVATSYNDDGIYFDGGAPDLRHAGSTAAGRARCSAGGRRLCAPQPRPLPLGSGALPAARDAWRAAARGIADGRARLGGQRLLRLRALSALRAARTGRLSREGTEMGQPTAWRRECAVACVLGGLLAGCGGGESEEPGPPPDPLPLAGGSRWAALEHDEDADGTIDEITLYSYDGQGRRTAARSYRAVAGVPDGEPTHELLWSFDRWSRIVGSIERFASGWVVTTSHHYGADGRQATRRTVAGNLTLDDHFSWRDERIVEITTVRSDRADRFVGRVAYGSDGRVSEVTRDPGWLGDGYQARYLWRPDGRPVAMSVYSGFVASYGFRYDADGRLVATSYNDDGIYFEEARLAHDAQGRLVQVEVGPAPEGGGFVPASRSRYRWERALCQPLVMPGEPPHHDWSMAGLVSADNVSFGCAP